MKIILFLSLIVLGLCAWAPWISEADAQTAIQLQFDSAFRASKPVYEGACTLTNLTNLHKVLFGYDATVSYDCEVSGEGTANITYTFYQGVLGAPAE